MQKKIRSNRRAFLKAGAAAAWLATQAPAKAQTPQKKPNILCILVDDLGYGDLSAYGAKDVQTPNIDALLAQGVRCTQFYANCPVCSPTRAALLSGRYPDLVGVPGVIRTHRDNNWGYLSPDATLLPQLLKPAGYHSAAIGKWHLGLEEPNTPNARGFDYFKGYLGDMMDDYYTHLRHGNNYMRENTQEIQPEGHATDLFSDWASTYIKEQAQQDNPFFLYLAYNAPHTPIQPPKDWLKKVRKRHPDMPLKRAAIVALIEDLDHGVGEVLKSLEESGQAENTLVLFASDNGGQCNVGASNTPWRGAKQQMFEGGIRVPAGARWPGKIPAETSTDALAVTMDFFPTICAACKIPLPHPIDGVDALPILKGKEKEGDDRTVFWVRREGGGYGGQAYYAARRGDFKILQNNPNEPFSFFNLKEDPKEEHPLPHKHPEYQYLFTALRNHINRSGAVPWQAPGIDFEFEKR